LQNVEGYETVNSKNTGQWFDIDNTKLGYEVLGHIEIVRRARNQIDYGE
jgi:hypothetical protein